MLCFIVVLSLCYCVSSWVKLLLLARITSPLIMNLWCDMNRQTLGTRYRSAYPYVTHTHTHMSHTQIKHLCEHANKCEEALAKLEHWLALACWNTQRLVNSFHWVFFTLSSWGWRWKRNENKNVQTKGLTARERWGRAKWGQTETIMLTENLF